MATSFERVQVWLQSSTAFSLPLLNEDGLSRAVINDDCIVHLVASPNPNPHGKDDFFLYVPLASTKLITKDNAETFLTFMGEQNMMANLPAGFRLGMSHESHYFWLSGRFATEYMNLYDFEKCVKECIIAAEFLMKEIRALAEDADQAPNLNMAINMDADMAPDGAPAQYTMPSTVLWG